VQSEEWGVKMMNLEDTAKYKSKKLSVRIINLYKYLCETKNEYVIIHN